MSEISLRPIERNYIYTFSWWCLKTSEITIVLFEILNLLLFLNVIYTCIWLTLAYAKTPFIYLFIHIY
jgi:hypothetical protein